MRVLLKDIPSTEKHIEFELERGPLNERLSSAAVDKLPLSFEREPSCKMTLRKVSSSVFAEGVVRGSYNSSCARCLEPIENQLEAPFMIALKPKPLGDDGSAEDLSFGYYQDEAIDCGDLAQEFLVLGVPFQPLCSASCKGLCDQCGVNLNHDDCGCAEDKPKDARMSALWGLKAI